VVDALSMGCRVFYWGWHEYFNSLPNKAVMPFANTYALKIVIEYHRLIIRSDIYENYAKNHAEKIVEISKAHMICEDGIYNANKDLFL
jgi:hypothetical protein